MDPLAESLIRKTDPGPYGQAIFLSQKMINEAFDDMWYFTPEDDPPPLREYKEDFFSGSVDMQLNAPTVKLMVTTKQDPQLYFMLNIKSGKITIYTGKSPKDPKPKDFDVAGWTFGFAVKIARKEVKKDDPKFSAAVTSAGFSPDVYSLAQLYLDISSSTVNHEQYNSYGAYDWQKEDPRTRSVFDSFCQEWWNEMKERNCNVVGYSLQATDSDPTKVDAATFPPTSIDYWVYPWLDPNVSNPPLTDDSPNNALCYLMMSDFKPSPARVGIEYSGAFVNGGGLYVMNSDNFWGNWLIPLMQGLNKGAEIIPLEPVAEYRPERATYQFDTNIRYSVGVDGDSGTTDPYFAFTKSSSQPPTWTWSGAEKTSSKTTSNGAGIVLEVSQKSITSTELSFDEGGRRVHLKGKTVFDFHTQFIQHGIMDEPSHMTTTVDWNFKMSLSTVNDGGIQFARVPLTPEDTCSVSISAAKGNVQWKYGFDEASQFFGDGLNMYLNHDTLQIENALLGSLRGQDRLLLPAAGTFSMVDPMFNSRGDLLVTLKYHNADPPNPPAMSFMMMQTPASIPITTVKPGIRGPVSINVEGLPPRTEPRAASKPQTRYGGIAIPVSV
ncbi:hypothetical protein F4777DRAFT_207732 [Nemania sp. FL0916]|nr:hypothetical protein F4777DRAFT_207732 [Nemania sp. FL0916]